MSVPCPLGLSESPAALPARVSKPSVSTCAPRFLSSDASFEALSRATSNRDLPPCQPCSGSVILADLSTSRTTRAGSSRVPRLMARGAIDRGSGPPVCIQTQPGKQHGQDNGPGPHIHGQTCVCGKKEHSVIYTCSCFAVAKLRQYIH